MGAGNPLGDHGQRAIVLVVVLEPVLADEHGVRVSAPPPQQRGTGLQHDRGVGARSAFLELGGEGLQAAPQRSAHAAMGALLQLIGEGSDEQIATESQGRSGTMQLAPGKPQIVRRLIRQSGNLEFDVPVSRSVVLLATAARNRRLASMLASPSVVGWRLHTLAASAMR
jgi:hypothetical protein